MKNWRILKKITNKRLLALIEWTPKLSIRGVLELSQFLEDKVEYVEVSLLTAPTNCQLLRVLRLVQ